MAQVDGTGRDELRAKLVQELVDQGMDEWDAQFAVRLHLGETMGDVVGDPPMTAEDYRAIGLNRDFLFDLPPELAALEEASHPRRRS